LLVNKFRIIFIFSFLISTISFCKTNDLITIPEGTVSGYVYDGISNEPVGNVEIFLMGNLLTTYSDGDGYFSFNVPVGDWTLVIRANDYQDLLYDVSILEGEEELIEVSIVPVIVNIIKGTVIDAGTNEPVAYAAVIVVELGIGGYTKADGTFKIENVPTGVWSVQAELIGYTPTIIEDVEVIKGGVTEIDISLVRKYFEGYNIQLGPNDDETIDESMRLESEIGKPDLTN